MNEDENMAAWFSLSGDWQIGGVVPLVPKYERDEARRVAREWYREAQKWRETALHQAGLAGGNYARYERSNRRSAVWKRAAKYYRKWNMYFEKKCFEWQGQYFKMKDRAEAAEAERDRFRAGFDVAERQLDEYRAEAEKWRREYETEKRYLDNRTLSWQKDNIEQRRRTETAEQRVQELEEEAAVMRGLLIRASDYVPDYLDEEIAEII